MKRLKLIAMLFGSRAGIWLSLSIPGTLYLMKILSRKKSIVSANFTKLMMLQWWLIASFQKKAYFWTWCQVASHREMYTRKNICHPLSTLMELLLGYYELNSVQMVNYSYRNQIKVQYGFGTSGLKHYLNMLMKKLSCHWIQAPSYS